MIDYPNDGVSASPKEIYLRLWDYPQWVVSSLDILLGGAEIMQHLLNIGSPNELIHENRQV